MYPLAIAAAVLLAVTGAVKWTPLGDQIDAWLHRAPTTPVPLPVPPTHEETPQEKAAKLREMALVNAQKGYFGDADDELDAADVLDPAGHDSSTAQATRKIFEDEESKVPHFAKAPIGPGERPLIPKKRHVH